MCSPSIQVFSFSSSDIIMKAMRDTQPMHMVSHPCSLMPISSIGPRKKSKLKTALWLLPQEIAQMGCFVFLSRKMKLIAFKYKKMVSCKSIISSSEKDTGVNVSHMVPLSRSTKSSLLRVNEKSCSPDNI